MGMVSGQLRPDKTRTAHAKALSEVVGAKVVASAWVMGLRGCSLANFWPDNMVRTKKPTYLPVVFTPEEAMGVIGELKGRRWFETSLTQLCFRAAP